MMRTPDQSREDELAVIEAFAQQMMPGGSGILTVGQLIGPDASRWHDLRMATKRLEDRGWLGVNSVLHLEDHHECILMGEGLRRAQARVAELRKESSTKRRQIEPP